MIAVIFNSFLETVLMTAVSFVIGILLGGPLAILLYLTSQGGLAEHKWVNQSLGLLINSARSVPYIILTVLLIPLTRILTGSSIGTLSAVIPLGVSAILLTARVVEEAFRSLPHGYLDLGVSLGASRLQIIRMIVIPETLPNIVAGLTLILINLTGFSAMAGAVGGGGLGDLAIRYGYQRYDLTVLTVVVLILIVWVQLIQFGGEKLAKKLRK